jgi:hypothetical protein
MTELPTYGNAVVYSEKAWAVARRASGGDDIWFADCGAHARGAMNSRVLLEWADDWVEMIPKETEWRHPSGLTRDEYNERSQGHG